MASSSTDLVVAPKPAAPRRADTEFLLHDGLHLQPQLPLSRRPPLSISAAEAAAIRRPKVKQIARLVHSLSSDGVGSVTIPAPPFDAAEHARDVVFRWNQLSADPSLALVGRQLLTECLQEDHALTLRRRRCDPYAGNALRVLDGHIGDAPRVLHAHGEHMDQISLRSLCTPEAPVVATCALPKSHRDRLLELSLCASDDHPGRPRRLVARSAYWVHHYHLAESGCDDGPSLKHVASTRPNCLLGHGRPLHAALNPVLHAEAAVLLDDGRVQLLRLDRAAASSASSSAATDAAAVPSAFEYLAADIGRLPLCSGQQPAPSVHEEPWGALEYADHPRTLYIASGHGVSLVDVRVGSASAALLFDVRRLPLSELRVGSMAVPHCTRRMPVAASPGGPARGANTSAAAAAPLVAIASREQLLVIDARAPQRPLHQMRLPLPLPPPGGSASASSSDAATQPRYTLEFSRCNGALLLTDLTSARPYMISLAPRSHHGDDDDGACMSSARPSQHGGRFAHLSPCAAAIPISLDPDCMMRRRFSVVETLSGMGSALPLAGAAIFPLPRGWPAGGADGHAWAMAVLSARGEVDLMCEDMCEDATDAATREPPTDEDARHASTVVSGLHPPRAAVRAPWEECIVEKRHARRDGSFDEFRLLDPKHVDRLRTRLDALREAAPVEAAPAAAVQSSSIAPFVALEDDEPIMHEIAAQWADWAGATGLGGAAAGCAPAPSDAPRSAPAGGGRSGGPPADPSRAMPPPPPRISLGSSHRSPGLVSSVGASAFDKRRKSAPPAIAAARLGAESAESRRPSVGSSAQPPAPSSDPFRFGKSAAKRPRRSSGF